MPNLPRDNDRREEERREYTRSSVHCSLRVVDLDNDTLLGDVADISMSGMRLVSEVPIPVKTTFRVRLDVVLGNGYQEQACFETYSVWSHEGPNPGLYETGLRHVLSPRTLANFQRLVDMIRSMA